MRREVERLGLSLADVALHAPIGLPIGGDTPGEIAISIVAQMVGVRSARSAEAADARSAAG